MWILYGFIILILVLSLTYDIVEGFRGRGKGKGRGPGKRFPKGRKRYPGKYRRRFPGWVRGPRTRMYDVPDNYYWGGWRPSWPPVIYDYYPSWLYTARCRKGCGFLGNGVVGCVNPTNTPDSCIFASDCYGC